MLAGYIGSGGRFAEAIMKFAEAYADQTERDWQALLKSRHAPKKAASQPQAASQQVSVNSASQRASKPA
jgi:hypothetical protein